MQSKLKTHIPFYLKARSISIYLIEIIFKIMSRNYSTYIVIIKLFPTWVLAHYSKTNALLAYWHAEKNVPAYKLFLQQSESQGGYIPETDKKSYIIPFSIESRCVGGVIPKMNVVIDESSGSTGTPFDWVRSEAEREESLTFVNYFVKLNIGEDPLLTINAFSQGAWATGLTMGQALQKNGIVKNTGPDMQKIFHTLSFFGPSYKYLILGYPPFIKHLIDEAKRQNFPLEQYQLNAIVGGEGMSEGLRDYLLTVFRKVYSGYGATDLEIGIAGETNLSVAIRRIAKDAPEIRKELFGDDPRLPMVFQYNPFLYYIETNDSEELVFTINRKALLSPRIRYNVHDKGGVTDFPTMLNKLKRYGYKLEEVLISKEYLKLPFVWVYGRKDYTISIMGANIYPEDVESSLYNIPELANITKSYCLSVKEEDNGAIRPKLLFEVYEMPSPDKKELYKKQLLNELIALNTDFREAYKEYSATLVPEIEYIIENEGIYKHQTGQIKQLRISK